MKRISASALSEICKHSAELAQFVVDAGAVPFLAQLINHQDAQLKRQVCSCLANISRHTQDLADNVVNNDIFPKILYKLKDPDELVRRFSAMCIREIAKQSVDLAKLICNSGGAVAIVDYVTETKGPDALPGIVTLGYISSFDESLAMGIISAKGIPPLKDCLHRDNHESLKSAAVWSLGHMGEHSPDHARAMADHDIPRLILELYKDPSSS